MNKPCLRCGISQPESEYYKNHHSVGGRINVCRTCKRTRENFLRHEAATISGLLQMWGRA